MTASDLLHLDAEGAAESYVAQFLTAFPISLGGQAIPVRSGFLDEVERPDRPVFIVSTLTDETELVTGDLHAFATCRVSVQLETYAATNSTGSARAGTDGIDSSRLRCELRDRLRDEPKWNQFFQSIRTELDADPVTANECPKWVPTKYHFDTGETREDEDSRERELDTVFVVTLNRFT